MIVKGVASKKRQKLMRNLRVNHSVSCIHDHSVIYAEVICVIFTANSLLKGLINNYFYTLCKKAHKNYYYNK